MKEIFLKINFIQAPFAPHHVFEINVRSGLSLKAIFDILSLHDEFFAKNVYSHGAFVSYFGIMADKKKIIAPKDIFKFIVEQDMLIEIFPLSAGG